jgi:hypothetical protein
MLGIEPALEPLERKVYNQHFDNLLKTGQLNPDILVHCDKYQMYALNEVKKALVRLEKQQ